MRDIASLLEALEIRHVAHCEVYVQEIEAINPLPEGTAPEVHAAFRQLIRQAVLWGTFLEHNNPLPK